METVCQKGHHFKHPLHHALQLAGLLRSLDLAPAWKYHILFISVHASQSSMENCVWFLTHFHLLIYIFPFFNKSLFVLINYIEYKVYHFRHFKYRVQRHVVYAICPVQPSPGLRSFLFSPFIQHQLYFSLPNLGHGNNYSFFVFFKKIIFMYLYVYVKQTYAHGGQRYGDPLGLES